MPKKGRGADAAAAKGVEPQAKKSAATPVLDRRHWLVLLALWALTLAAYSNSFQAGLVYDNTSRIVEDARVHSATSANVDLILHSEYWYPALATGLYRPLTTLSFLFNYAVLGNGARPAGYHFINWVLHSINASLIFLLAVMLLGEVFPAAAIAAIWAVHPVLTESVTNVVGRADMLAGIGVLGGLASYIQAMRSPGRRRWMWLGAAAVASAIGTFSKESALVVLPVVGLYELLFGASKERNARIAGYAALAFPIGVYWLTRMQVFADAAPFRIPYTDNPIASAGFIEARLTAIKVAGREMALMLWPAALSCDYSYNEIPLASWGDWRVWLALAACLGAALAGVVCYRKNRPAAFAVGFFFLTLAPTSNIAVAIGTPMAERLLYLPAIGFASGAVAAVAWALKRMPPVGARVALAIIVAALGARTFARNFDWKDETTLWRSAARASTGSYKTHLTVSNFETADPIPEVEKAVAIVNSLPDEVNAVMPFVAAGVRYREKGGKTGGAEAGEWYRKSLDMLLRAERIQDLHNGRIVKMREEQHTNRFNPAWSPAYEELGRTYMRLLQFPKAAEAFRKGLDLKPSARGFEQLSVAYYSAGDRARAAIALFEGMAMDPKDQKLGLDLASLYGEIDPGGCAVVRTGSGASLNMGCPMVHQHACAAWRNVAALHTRQARPEVAAQTLAYAANTLKCGPEDTPGRSPDIR